MYGPPTNYIPQCGDDRGPLIVWLIVTVAALFLIALIFGAPIAQANEFGVLSFSIYQAFSHLCHQLPERSFFVAGYQLAVCARCTGVYVGFAAAVISYPLFRSLRTTQLPDKKWLFIAATPLTIDFGLGLLGIWENTHTSRFVTAALLGIVSVFYIMPALVELVHRSQSRRSVSSQNIDVGTAPIPQAPLTAPSDYSSPHRRI